MSETTKGQAASPVDQLHDDFAADVLNLLWLRGEKDLAAYRAAHSYMVAVRDEIDRCHSAVRQANAQVERFEREFYLRGDEIDRQAAEIARLTEERDAYRASSEIRGANVEAMRNAPARSTELLGE